MFFLGSFLYTSPPDATDLMHMVLNIVLSILTFLIALGLGLLLRRLLVRRLQRTVLDNWVVQTLGVLVILPLLALAAITIVVIWDLVLLFKIWYFLFPNQDFSSLTKLTGNLFGTALLIAFGIGVARTIRKLTTRGLGENRIDINIRTLIGRIFYFIVLMIAAFWILTIWQVQLTVPVAAIGVLTVATAVAIQDILKDLVAGFYILLERPFYIGDQISITNNTITYTGKVEDIQLRAAKLRLVSGEEVTIPNSLVFGGVVTNNSLYGERRAVIAIKLPQEDFVKEETASQILQALKDFEAIIPKPEPAALVSGYANQQITLTLRFWIANGQHAIVSDVVYTLHTLLPSAELTVLESAGNI